MVLRSAWLREVSQGEMLYDASEPHQRVYFPLGGLIGITSQFGDGSSLVVAEVGIEGMVGLTAALGGRRQPMAAIVDVVGEVLDVPVGTIQDLMGRDASTRAAVQRYASLRLAQTELNAACLARHTVEARLARWLLRAWEATARDGALLMTQERLSQVLGTHRPSITLASQRLRDRGAIGHRRGSVVVVDVERLAEASCACYEAFRALAESA
ncbi:MAG: Crp/Fnr family transcriptional regulator [Dehalococcoidia bacterium]